MTLVFRDPEELDRFGVEVIPHRSLLETEQYDHWVRTLDRWIERIPHLRTPFPDGLIPNPHQRKYAAMGACRRHNLFLWTVGTQKTLTSILHIFAWYGEELFKGLPWDALDDDQRRQFMKNWTPNLPPGAIHIVTRKKILRKTWMTELRRTGLDQFAAIIESESQLVNNTKPIILYNFDFPSRIQTDRGRTMKALGMGKRLKENGTLYFRGHPMSKLIRKRFPPSLLILDEVHRLRPGTDRTTELSYIRRKAKKVIGLTATPMDGWLSHYGCVLSVIFGLNNESFPYSSAHDFAKRYMRVKVVTQDVVTGGETLGKKRPMPGVHPLQVPAFVQATRHLAHRLTSQDPEVKKNVKFPPIKTFRVMVEMDPQHELFYRNLYLLKEEELQQNLVAAKTRGMKRARARIDMLELISQLRMATACPTALGYEGPSIQKFERALEICKQAQRRGLKVLIYTNFIEESRAIHEYLQAHGVGSCRIYVQDPKANPRSLSEEAQMDVLDKHEDEDDLVSLSSNLELIAEGLTLTWASVVINLSPCWRGNLYAQGLGRIARPGQVHDWVEVYDLLTLGTIELYIDRMLKAKHKANNAFVDQDFSNASSPELDAFELGQLLSQGAIA